MSKLMPQRKIHSSFCGGKIKVWRTVKAPESGSRDSYFVRTMETASLRMLSPNTNMLRTGSTFRALKMAMVATGSTAEISEPKAKLQQDGEHLGVKDSCAAVCDASAHLSVMVIL